MDILNFISWLKGGRVVNTVDAAKTLLPVGLKDNRRDDAYLAGAITVEDFTTQVGDTVRPYKVFTALLTQSGGDNELSLLGQDTPNLTIGVTYQIGDDGGSGWDFTNVGAPNNDLFTYFVATGTTPASWGSNGYLIYNTGAPVVTILENTIGNIWFGYNGTGDYSIISDDLFTNGKTWVDTAIILGTGGSANRGSMYVNAPSNIGIQTETNVDTASNNLLGNTPIEIRVYN